MEGQNIKSELYDRVLGIVHIDLLISLAGLNNEPEDNTTSSTTITTTATKKNNNSSKSIANNDDIDTNSTLSLTNSIMESEEYQENEKTLSTQSMVLLQMLCEAKPSLRIDYNLTSDLKEIAKSGE